MPSRVEYEVVVVGAGPGGSAAAAACAQAGLGPVLMVDRASFPRYKPCGSAVSNRALEELARVGAAEAIEAVGQPLDRAHITSPDGISLTLPGRRGFVVNRSPLDQILADAAVAAGAEFVDGVRVKALVRAPNGTVTGVTLDGGDISARWVIVATGAHAALLDRPPADVRLITCVTWIEGLGLERGDYEVAYDAEFVPHYAWVFPETETVANVGLCVEPGRLTGSVSDSLKRFVDRYLGPRLGGAQPIGGYRGFPILCNTSARYEAPPGVLVVGEAARLVDARTGEGIRQAIVSGYAAADLIKEGRDASWGAPKVAAEHRAFLADRYDGELSRAALGLASGKAPKPRLGAKI